MLRRIITLLIWTVLAVSIVLATVILVELGRGYSYDFKTGELKLSGLVVFGSNPSGADIFASGKTIHRRTPYRSTFEAGQYLFTITKPGYRQWSKQVTIFPSEVSWVQYVLLIPTVIKQTTITTNPAISLLATSTDHRHFAYVASDGAVWTFDSSLRTPSRLYQPSAPAVGQPVEQITALAWSNDASHLLISTTSGASQLSRLVNLSDGTVTKLTESFGFSFTDLRFSPNNWQVLYWLSPEGLRQINVSNQTVSAVLADNVSTYQFAGNQIVYTETTATSTTLDSMGQTGQNKRQLAKLEVSPSYQLGYSTYLNTPMVAVLPSTTRTITLYKDAFSGHPTSQVVTRAADTLAFNTDGRFLNYRDGQRLATYDLEKAQTYLFEPSPQPYGVVEWFDTYHLLAATANEISIVEYDGGNLTSITGASLAAGVGVTDSEHSIVSVSPTKDGGFKLISSEIKP